MPIAIDIITRKKLILIKQIFQQALIQSEARYSNVSKVMALIGFDLAAETMLKTIASTLDQSRIPSDGFQGLIQQVDEMLSKNTLPALPDKVNIQHVHSIRNDAQHKAKYPNEIDVSDCRTYVRDFLQKIIQDVWGLSFESMSLTDVIQHERVKERLIEAETALASGDYLEAVVKSEVGWGMASTLVSPSIVGRFPDAKALVIVDTFGAVKHDGPALQAFKRMQELLTLSVVGLNFVDHIKYRKIVDSVIQSVIFSGDWNYQVVLSSKKPEQKEAEFAVSYAVNAVIQIESQVGSLDAP